MSIEDRQRLCKFVTSCPRPPLLGFKELHPKFAILLEAWREEDANTRLPTSSTCVNLLRLPRYSTKEMLR
ncbi:Ubiquitin-protein ligase E3C, partial [Spiromyces aspiralis]